jgi:hypothetical protein
MTYFKIGLTLIRASRIVAASPSADDGLLLAMEGGGEIHLDRDQAALFRAHVSPGPGKGAFQSRAVTGLGTVIEFLAATAPSDVPAPGGPAHLRFT